MQHGITRTFDTPARAGQFVNGDRTGAGMPPADRWKTLKPSPDGAALPRARTATDGRPPEPRADAAKAGAAEKNVNK